jgi:16S rRNA processing protein RimM
MPAGRVGRPHGLDGSFYVTRALARLLQVGVEVTLAGRRAAIVRRAGTEQRPIVRVEGVEDRPAAEALRGMELVVEGAQAPALGEQEWWAHELAGCEVVDGGELLGTVSRLIELPSCVALEVRPPGGGEAVLVPMVADAIREVVIAHRRIEVDLEFLGLAGRGAGGAGERVPPQPKPRRRKPGGPDGGEGGGVA